MSSTDRPRVVFAVEPAAVGREDAAPMLGMSVAQFDAELRAGRFGPLPLPIGGRRLLFCLAEIRKWVEAGCPPRVRWIAMKQGQPRLTG